MAVFVIKYIKTCSVLVAHKMVQHNVIRTIFMVLFTVTVPVKVNIFFCLMIKGCLDFLFSNLLSCFKAERNDNICSYLLFSRSVALQSTLHQR